MGSIDAPQFIRDKMKQQVQQKAEQDTNGTSLDAPDFIKKKEGGTSGGGNGSQDFSGKRPSTNKGFAVQPNYGDVQTQNTPSFNANEFLAKDLNATNKAFVPDMDFGMQLAAYHADRNKQFDNQKNILKSKILNAYQDKNVQQGDIGQGIQKKFTIKPPVEDKTLSEVDNLHAGINDINDYQQKLNKSIRHAASVYVGEKTDDPVTAGRMVRTILGDKGAEQEQRYEKEGNPIAPSAKFYNEKEGLDALHTSLDERYADKTDPEYLKQKALLDNQAENLINKYPEFKRQQLSKAIVQQILKDHPNPDSMMMLPYAFQASKELGLSKDDLKNIDFDNLPYQNMAGTALGVAYNTVLNLGAGIARAGGSLVGIPDDYLNSHLQDALSKGQQRFEDVSTLQGAATIVDTDKNSPTYLQDIPNPEKGKYNYNFHTVSNAITNGIVNLAGIVATTKGFGGIAKSIAPAITPVTEADLGMAGAMIGQGYEPYYQQARDVVSDKPQDERKRHLYALLNGSLDYFAFKPLTKLQELVNPQQAKELGAILKDAPSLEDVSRTKLKNWTSKVLEGSKNALTETGVIGASTSLADVGKNLVDNILGSPEGAKKSNMELGNKMIDNIQSLPFTMMIPLGIGEFAKGIKHSYTFKENLYNAGLNPETYKAQAHQLLEKGVIDQSQYDKRLQVINTVNDVVKSIPEELELNHNQKVAYVNSKMKELAYQAKADNIKDGALENYYKGKIQEEVKKRIDIVNGGETKNENLQTDKEISKANKEKEDNQFVKEAFDNGLAPKADRSMLLTDGAFDESKIDPYLQLVSEQAQGKDKDGNKLPNGAREESMLRNGYDKSLIELAKERFPLDGTQTESGQGENKTEPSQEKPSSSSTVGLSHGDWLDRNKDKFTPEEYNRLSNDLTSDNPDLKQKAIDDIVAKKEELKNISSQQNTNNHASTSRSQQQQESNREGDQPKYARTQQAGSEATPTGTESSNSNIGSEGGKEKVSPESESISNLEKIPFHERTDKQHADLIRQKFVKEFTDKGVPKDQVNAAVALLDARAKVANPKNPDAYFRKIQDIGKGEFQKGTPRLMQMPNGENKMVVPVAPEVVDGFYSPIEKRITEFKQPQASVNKWREIVGSKDEAKYTGISDWLSSLKPNEQVSKEQILQHLKDNRVQINEVVKGGKDEVFDYDNAPTEVKKAIDKYGIEDVDALREALEPKGYQISVGMDGEIESINKGGTPTKYGQYQLPGEKENYKEVLITMPSRSQEVAQGNIDSFKQSMRDKYGNGWRDKMSEAESKNFNALANGENKTAPEFKSSHFDEPNILAHLRMNTRTDAEGKKVLFLEEVQSDWGQKGKREGFVTSPLKELPKGYGIGDLGDGMTEGRYYIVYNGEKLVSGNTKEQAIEKAKNFIANRGKVQTAPFVTDTNQWTKLALKYAIRHAVEEGADKIAWTTGEQQNERYDLSKQVDAIHYVKEKDGTYSFNAEKDGNEFVFTKNNVPENELQGLVGKEVANKMIHNEGEDKKSNGARKGAKTLRGTDLQVGGNGMKGFYGSPEENKPGIIGNVAKSLVKELTGKEGKIGETKIETGEAQKSLEGFTPNEITANDITWDGNQYYVKGEFFGLDNSNRSKEAKTADIVKDYNENYIEKPKPEGIFSTQHSIEITPELKAAVEEGMPLFQNTNGKPKGAVETLANGRKIIHALDAPDFTTAVHEIAHIFEDELSPEERKVVTDFSKQEKWNTKTSETFARGFEKYLKEGNAPTPELKNIFQKAKEWITDIYNKLKQSGTVKITPDLKKVFDDLFKPEAEDKTPEKEPVKVSDLQSRNKVYKLASQMEEPPTTDVTGTVLHYFANGGKVSEESAQKEVTGFRNGKKTEDITESSLTGKRVTLGKEQQIEVNGEKKTTRERNIEESPSINELAQQMQRSADQHGETGLTDQDFRNEIVNAIQQFGSREELAKHYVETYHPDVADAKEREKYAEYEQQYKDEIAAEEKAMNDMLADQSRQEEEINASPDYINHLIKIYESETGKPITEQDNTGNKGEGTSPLGGEGGSGTEAEGEGIEPPEPPQEAEANASDNLNQWTRINLKSLTEMKNQFRKVGISWDDRAKEAMQNLASRSRKGETLVQTAAREMDNFFGQLKTDKKIRFNTEDQVAMHFLKIALQQDMAKEADYAQNNGDFSSINSIASQVLGEQFDRVNAVLGAMRSESGAGLGYGNVEARLHPDYGLQVRQLQMIKANNGEPLNEETQQFVKDQWEKEKEITRKIHEAEKESLKKDFENQLAALQKDYEDKLKKKTPSTIREKTLSQKGKKVADQIRKLKSSGLQVDFTFGTWNLAVEGIAKLAEAGFTIADAIDSLIKDKVIGFKDDKERNKFENKFISELNNQAKREDAYDVIKSMANGGSLTDITQDMVANNHIKDFVDSYIGKVPTKDILKKASEDLQKILPDTNEDILREAYLKKGQFTPETQKQIKTDIRQQQDKLKKIAQKELTADQQQKIKLQAEKEKAVKKIEEFRKKLEHLEKTGELEGAINELPVRLNKHDAELIQLHREQAKVESLYRQKQHDLREKAKHPLERAGDTVRSLWIMYLIASPKTYAKIAWMSLMRPTSEAVGKLTFGQAFKLLSPEIYKAAKRGGESASLLSVKKMASAYLRQLGSEGLQRLYEKSEKEYYDAYEKYDSYKNSENPNEERLKSLKKDMDNKMLSSLGNLMYQFIGGSSFKDAFQSLVNRSNIIENQFGKVSKDHFKEGNWLDKVNYIAAFVGRSHSAIKTFSGRASFAGAFMARVEAALADGEEVRHNKLIEIAHESYLDWERGKYQQSNYISDKWNHIIQNIEDKNQKPEWQKYDKALKGGLGTEVAITRVPVNIIHEEVAEYLLGAFRAPILAIKEYNKAFKQAIDEGHAQEIGNEGGDVVLSKEFKDRVKELVSGMDGLQAAKIIRNFRKGGLGLGLYTVAALWGIAHFGGFQHKGQGKKKDEKDLKEGELNPGQIMFGNDRLGEVMSGVIEHTPALWDTWSGLGISYLYHKDIKAGKTTSKAATDAINAHLEAIEGNIPQSKIISPLSMSKEMAKSLKKSTDNIGLTIPTDTKGGLPKGSIGRKYLEDNNIEIPELDNTKIKIAVDARHPEGKMRPNEFEEFKGLRTKLLDEKISNLAASQLAKELTNDQIKDAAKQAESQATKEAKEIMIKQGVFSENKKRSGEEQRQKAEIKSLFRKGSGGGGGGSSNKFSIRNF